MSEDSICQYDYIFRFDYYKIIFPDYRLVRFADFPKCCEALLQCRDGSSMIKGPYLKFFFGEQRPRPPPAPVDNFLGKTNIQNEYVAIAFQWLYPSINLLHYCKVLLEYSIWIVIVVHSSLIIMLLLKLLNLILSLIIFGFIMKNSTVAVWVLFKRVQHDAHHCEN
jgi:hypothetical protein